MTDPLGLIGQSGGVQPTGPARPPAGGAKPDPDAPNFSDLLMKNLEEVNRLQADASRAAEDLAAGRRDDVETVLAATAKADMAFRMLLQVRNKVLESYEELKQIQV